MDLQSSTFLLMTGLLALLGLALVVNAAVATAVRQCRRGIATGWRMLRAAVGSGGGRNAPAATPAAPSQRAVLPVSGARPKRRESSRSGRRQRLAHR